MDSDSSVFRLGRVPEKDELSARVSWDGYNTPDSHLVTKRVLAPCHAFVSTVQNPISGHFVISHNKNRARVAKFPKMGVLMHFFPSEASVATQERIAFCVRGEMFSYVAYGHHKTRDGWSAVG